jgi:hypothetical protein
MNHDRQKEIERIKTLIDRAEEGDREPLFQALRASLALRPASRDLSRAVVRRMSELARDSDGAGGKPDFAELARRAARQLIGPSARAMNPDHPVGSAAFAIQQELPEFQPWTIDPDDAVATVLSSRSDPDDRSQPVLPPGFAEGRPGAFIRGTHALLLQGDDGSLRTTYEALQGSGDLQSFRAGMQRARTGDVMELAWMVAGSLELRAVQALLERVCAAVAPGVPSRFTHYDEPRYRSALRLQLGENQVPAAIGGVLAGWPGQPPGTGVAHLRLFLEPWATARTGHVVEFGCVLWPPSP